MHVFVLQTLLKCMFYMNQLYECLFNRVVSVSAMQPFF